MSENVMYEYQDYRRALWFALRTRLLTEEELTAAYAQGHNLNIEMRVSYNPDQKARELADAWTVQGMMRATAMRTNVGSNNSLFEIRELGT